ncbi:GIP [Symbiodinium sp. CCMP2592]|nr:GIP [Symbiodinium sp. CCMP2592]
MDWLEVITTTMQDLSDGSAAWWTRVRALADESYRTWTHASPVEKLSIQPPRDEELETGRWSRVNSRGGSMIMLALHDSVRQEMVQRRSTGSVTALVFRLLTIYQPGRQQETVMILQNLQQPEPEHSAQKAVKALRTWARWLRRCKELGVSAPDPSLLMRGLSTITKNVLEKDAEASFRTSLVKSHLSVDTKPSLDSVEKYYHHLLAECGTITDGKGYQHLNHDNHSASDYSAKDCGADPSKILFLFRDKWCYVGNVVEDYGVAMDKTKIETEGVIKAVCDDAVSVEEVLGLLESGASHAMRPAKEEEYMEGQPVRVTLAGEDVRVLKQNNEGTILVQEENSVIQPIVPSGAVIENLGCTLHWFAAAGALGLTRELEMSQVNTLNEHVASLRARLEVIQKEEKRDWATRFLKDWIQTNAVERRSSLPLCDENYKNDPFNAIPLAGKIVLDIDITKSKLWDLTAAQQQKVDAETACVAKQLMTWFLAQMNGQRDVGFLLELPAECERLRNDDPVRASVWTTEMWKAFRSVAGMKEVSFYMGAYGHKAKEFKELVSELIRDYHSARWQDEEELVQNGATGYQHRRRKNPQMYTIALDLAGPFKQKCRYMEHEDYKYIMVAAYRCPREYMSAKAIEELDKEFYVPDDPLEFDGEDPMEVLHDRGNAQRSSDSEKDEEEEESLPLGPETLDDAVEGLSQSEKWATMYVTRPLRGRTNHYVVQAAKEILLQLKQTGLHVETIHTDRAREFKAKAFKEWTVDSKLRHTKTTGADPSGNSSAELGIKWAKARVRALLGAAKASPRDWPMAMQHAAATAWAKAFPASSWTTPPATAFGNEVWFRSKAYQGKKEKKHEAAGARWKKGVYRGPAMDVGRGHLIMREDGGLTVAKSVKYDVVEPERDLQGLLEPAIGGGIPDEWFGDGKPQTLGELKDEIEFRANKLNKEKNYDIGEVVKLYYLLENLGQSDARFNKKAPVTSWYTGAFVHGGVAGTRSNVKEFPKATKYLTEFAKYHTVDDDVEESECVTKALPNGADLLSEHGFNVDPESLNSPDEDTEEEDVSDGFSAFPAVKMMVAETAEVQYTPNIEGILEENEARGKQLEEFKNLTAVKRAFTVKKRNQLPPDCRIVPYKGVYTVKPDKALPGYRRKTRFVACGNHVPEDAAFLDLFASGRDATSLRAMLALSARKPWRIGTTDVRQAFVLAGWTGGPVALEPPGIAYALGLAVPGDVWYVEKALYGLRDSPALWAAFKDSQLKKARWEMSINLLLHAEEEEGFVNEILREERALIDAEPTAVDQKDPALKEAQRLLDYLNETKFYRLGLTQDTDEVTEELHVYTDRRQQLMTLSTAESELLEAVNEGQELYIKFTPGEFERADLGAKVKALRASASSAPKGKLTRVELKELQTLMTYEPGDLTEEQKERLCDLKEKFDNTMPKECSPLPRFPPDVKLMKDQSTQADYEPAFARVPPPPAPVREVIAGQFYQECWTGAASYALSMLLRGLENGGNRIY